MTNDNRETRAFDSVNMISASVVDADLGLSEYSYWKVWHLQEGSPPHSPNPTRAMLQSDPEGFGGQALCMPQNVTWSSDLVEILEVAFKWPWKAF